MVKYFDFLEVKKINAKMGGLTLIEGFENWSEPIKFL